MTFSFAGIYGEPLSVSPYQSKWTSSAYKKESSQFEYLFDIYNKQLHPSLVMIKGIEDIQIVANLHSHFPGIVTTYMAQ